MNRPKTRGVAAGPGDSLSRMRVALSPRFDATVIVLDDPDLTANLYPICSIDGCARFLSTRQLCQTHLGRWNKLGQPTLDEFRTMSGPKTNPEKIDLTGLPEKLRIELALSLQLLASSPRNRRRFRLQDLRDLIKELLAYKRIRQLTDENKRLEERLARAHGALREARH